MFSSTQINATTERVSEYKEVPIKNQSSNSLVQSDMRKTVKEMLDDETGMEALQVNDENFNKRLLLIKKQLENPDHPIKEVMSSFDTIFFGLYSPLIDKSIKKLQKSPSAEDIKEAQVQMEKVVAEVQNWVRIVFFSVLKFYRLNLMGESTFGIDVRKDLLLNMVTSMVMMDQTYSIVMNALL